VEVRSKSEILATLDHNGRLNNLPFQPEMLAYCGRRLRVASSAHKTCDTINKTGGRSMDHAVHLEGSRCDGALHGGCQADCQFFWKLDWLKPVNERSENAPAPRNTNCTEQTLLRATRAPGSDTDEQPVWVCQATALFEATSPLKWWDFRQYVRDVTSRNHSASHIFKVLLAAAYRKFVAIGPGYAIKVALYNRFQRLRGGMPFAAVSGQIPPGTSTPTGFLDLKPGEWVRVKSREEIATTITTDGFNRGMRHDNEMLRYSGGEYRVQMRVERLINERTGKMMQMKNPCIQLEDAFCRAECSAKRLGCPRALNSYWREIWLERIEQPANGNGARSPKP
jgi:hypothetical protein